MTCRQLGGACDEIFRANTFEEMAELSKQHGIKMFHSNDRAHTEAMNKMREMMHEEGKMEAWLENKKQEFKNLPNV